MKRLKYLILGAGPAGLTFANKLYQDGERSFAVLEKENEAGGLCRSREVDGAPFDIGGGHFLDVRRPEVDSFLFEFMPKDEWNLYTRDSRIIVNGFEVSHPIEANIWQLPLEEQVEYLKSIAAAGCNCGIHQPDAFMPWIYWKLGSKIADDYMIPYNRKMFNKELDELGTYWLEKLPNVSFEQTLMSCLTHKAYGTQPGHAQFFYPKKYGYGELWLRMADAISEHIFYDSTVNELDFGERSVRLADGTQLCAEHIISTIPWGTIESFVGMPDTIQSSIVKLRYSSVETRYYEDTMDTSAQWIYYPNPNLAYHRILVRSNFCNGSRGYWTETNSQRVSMIPENERDNFSYMNEYAYPLNTIDKPKVMKELLTWTQNQSVYGLGRWGEHEHYNSDLTVQKAIELEKRLYRR